MLGLYYDLLERSYNEDIAEARRDNRYMRANRSAFDMLDPEFIKTYRLSKQLVRDLIIDLSPLIPSPKRSDGITIETKVLVALAFFATGSYQKLVGQCKEHAVSQPTMSRSIQQVAKAMSTPTIMHKYVQFPIQQTDQENIKQRFYNKFGMPGVLGVIDGTHVAMVRPLLNEERYFNRKGYHSLNVMIICDSELQILCVDPSFPGSTNDSVVWGEHPLRLYFDQLRRHGENVYLLGDSGYPLRNTMVTPILNAPPRSPEAHFYEVHVTTRNTVERCIGVLKARFRCLLVARILHYQPLSVAHIVNACCILHNIANNANLPFNELTPEEYDYEAMHNVNNEVLESSDANYVVLQNNPRNRRVNQQLLEGRAVRQALVQYLWGERN